MNFLQISLTNKCNFSCWHCPMGKWRNSASPRWPLCNEILIPWLEKYVEPNKWLIELTGGEPSLYPEIDELLQWLSDHEYRVLVKTNGSGHMPHLRNVKLVAAFHKLDQPPQNFDEILIVDKINREEKEAYCKKNGITYHVIGYNKEDPDGANHGFKQIAFLNNAGHQVGCAARKVIEDVRSDGIDYRRITHRPLVPMQCCPHCKAAVDAWRFMEEEWKTQN